MKIGIDSYRHHRFFGEIYPGLETDPEMRLAITDVIDKARNAGAQGISIEGFMLPDDSAGLSTLLEKLSETGMDAVLGNSLSHMSGLTSARRVRA